KQIDVVVNERVGVFITNSEHGLLNRYSLAWTVTRCDQRKGVIGPNGIALPTSTAPCNGRGSTGNRLFDMSRRLRSSSHRRVNRRINHQVVLSEQPASRPSVFNE